MMQFISIYFFPAHNLIQQIICISIIQTRHKLKTEKTCFDATVNYLQILDVKRTDFLPCTKIERRRCLPAKKIVFNFHQQTPVSGVSSLVGNFSFYRRLILVSFDIYMVILNRKQSQTLIQNFSLKFQGKAKSMELEIPRRRDHKPVVYIACFIHKMKIHVKIDVVRYIHSYMYVWSANTLRYVLNKIKSFSLTCIKLSLFQHLHIF